MKTYKKFKKEELLSDPEVENEYQKLPVSFTWENYERYDNYEAKINSRDLTELTKNIEGRMLTIVDASFSDIRQRLAVKSLITNSLWKDIYENVQRCLYQRQKNSNAKYPLT